jgi:hypothetical protein
LTKLVLSMKRINPEDAHFYVKLTGDDPRKMEKAVAFTLTDSDMPGWQDVTYYGEGILDPTSSVKNPEYVYVLVNKTMPGICKIGMTTTSVNQRVKEINSATGVVSPWFSVFKYKCMNSRVLEKAVHDKLESLGYRVNPKREGFEIDSNTAIELIKELGESLTVTPKDFGK